MSSSKGPGHPLGYCCVAEPVGSPKEQEQNRTHHLPLTPLSPTFVKGQQQIQSCPASQGTGNKIQAPC